MTERSQLSGAASQAQGYWSLVWKHYRRHRSGMVGLAVLAFLLLLAFLSPLVAGARPIVTKYKGTVSFPAVVDVLHKIPLVEHLVAMPKPFRFPTFDAKREIREEQGDWALWPAVRWDPSDVDPINRLQAPSDAHVLGTDEVGRDVLSRMIHATPIAMLVGFVAMGIATTIGLLMGATAGYNGGRVDLVISRIIEVVTCIPVFYVILIVLTLTEPSIWNVMVVIGVFGWTGIARYTRGEFMKLRTLDYTLAARALGIPTTRIMFRHMLPNALAPVLVVVAFGIAGAIFTESGLSWLGFGVMPPTPTWGNILRTGYDNLRVAPHLIFPPAVAIFVAVLTLNLIGDALRDATDPRLTGSA